MSDEKRELTRKEFLALSATAAGATLISSVAEVRAVETKKPKWAMVMDVRRCIGCHACTVACKAENEVPLGVWRTHIRTYEKGKYPHAKRYFFQWICNHCGNCAEASQGAGLGSFSRREDGIVIFDYKKLQGKTAAQIKAEADLVISACPLEAIYVNPFTGFPEKCTFCVHRVEKGLVPACVQTCIPRARVFGDLSDPDSVVSKLIASNPTKKLCADGLVYYIGAEGHQIDSIKGNRQVDPQDFDKGILTQYL
jgi:tetrathionate reductase subunit B